MKTNPILATVGVAAIVLALAVEGFGPGTSPAPQPAPSPVPSPQPTPKPFPPPLKPKPRPGPWDEVWAPVGAAVGGTSAPDGSMEIHCDLPGPLHRRNTTSRGQGCCVWTSIHHSALYQNEPILQELPKYIQSKNYPGGSYPEYVERVIKEICKEKGVPLVPYVQVENSKDLEPLKLACRNGRMVAITYSRSPTGRYGGGSISHMVSLPHCCDKWAAVLDNNYIGADAYEWMDPEKELIGVANRGGYWAVILLNPGPPMPPRNTL